MPGRIIDWDDLKKACNEELHTNFANAHDMLVQLYKQHRSYDKVASLLGVSRNALMKKIGELGLKGMINRKFNTRDAFAKKAFLAIPDEQRLQMTSREIAEMIGCGHAHVCAMAKTMGLEYKRVYLKKEGASVG